MARSWHDHLSLWEKHKIKKGIRQDVRDAERVLEGGLDQVEKNLEQDAKDLEKWIIEQKEAYKAGTLDADKVAALEALEGWVW